MAVPSELLGRKREDARSFLLFFDYWSARIFSGFFSFELEFEISLKIGRNIPKKLRFN